MKNELLDKDIILPSGEIGKNKINLVAGGRRQTVLPDLLRHSYLMPRCVHTCQAEMERQHRKDNPSLPAVSPVLECMTCRSLMIWA